MISFTYTNQATPPVRILSGGTYLQINNAELGDTANYTCVASNIAGTTTREFGLTINGKKHYSLLHS
jgi:hemicentin